jgi:hypothetical protein
MGTIPIVIIRLPKTNAALDDQRWLRQDDLNVREIFFFADLTENAHAWVPHARLAQQFF